jgi:vacuolar protein sorting-associated protein 35
MVLVKDVKEGNLGGGPPARQRVREGPEMRELAEEQGWVARMVHLFRNDDLAVQYEVSPTLVESREEADVIVTSNCSETLCRGR